jgi:hypothetical protein
MGCLLFVQAARYTNAMDFYLIFAMVDDIIVFGIGVKNSMCCELLAISEI